MLKNILNSMAQNKHTSLAAIVGFATQAIPIFYPEWKPKCDELFKLAIIYGFALAGDASPKADPGAKNKSPLPVLLALGLLGSATMTGCAVSRQVATTTTTTTNGVVTVQAARSTTYALGDAKNVIDKIRASAGKTSSVGVTGTDQETASPVNSTNLSAAADLLRAAQGR